jgi:hypothetical protein
VTILSVIQDACLELKLPEPDTVIGNTDGNVTLLLALVQRAGKELRSKYSWPQLNKEHTFSTSNGTQAYALPADIDYQQFKTQWDRTNQWPLRGPIDAAEWQLKKSGIVTSHNRLGFRVKGYTSTQFYVEPTPSSAYTLVFEYQTKNWILPVAYATSTTFLAGTYCSHDGVIYYTSAGGTTSGVSPAADIGVTWTAYTSVYERFLADTDVSQIDEDVLTLEAIWRWKRANRFESEDLRMEAIQAADRAFSSLSSAPELSLVRRSITPLIGPWSVPDGGYGS